MKKESYFHSTLLCVLIVHLALLVDSSFAEPKLPAGAKAHRDLAYVSDGHPRQKFNLYLPAFPKCPLLVYIHGGAWLGGNKNDMDPSPLLAMGYSVASVEYRFSTDAIFPAQIEDCKAAVRWLRAHARDYGYDPKRVGAWGDSAGGHLTALLATTGETRDFDVGANLDQSSAIQCGIDFYGPTDIPGFKPPNSIPLVQRKGGESALVKLLGGPVDEKLELAGKASPVNWVSKTSTPLYIMHGTEDPLVPLDQSQRLADKMKAAGVEVTLDVVAGGGHGDAKFLNEERVKHLAEFLRRHLEQP